MSGPDLTPPFEPHCTGRWEFSSHAECRTWLLERYGLARAAGASNNTLHTIRRTITRIVPLCGG